MANQKINLSHIISIGKAKPLAIKFISKNSMNCKKIHVQPTDRISFNLVNLHTANTMVLEGRKHRGRWELEEKDVKTAFAYLVSSRSACLKNS